MQNPKMQILCSHIFYQNLAKLASFVIFALFFTSGFISTARAQKMLESGQRTGLVASASIGADYLHHKAGESRLGGLLMSINASLGWNWRDYGKLEFSGRFGAGTNNIYGAYPIGATQTSTQPLSSLSFKGGVFIEYGVEAKGGYNLASIFKAWKYPLFINVGSEIYALVEGAVYAPYSTGLVLTRFFVELDGGVVLSQKWALEYIARVSAAGGSVTFSGVDIVSNESSLDSIISGYGLKFGLGGRYKMGKNAYFFVRANVAYQNLSAGANKTIAIKTNPATNGLNAGATANVRYPASDSIYAGLQFGFGY
ncbi:hypothetical protein [Helicobacter sp. T3_23-1056]